MSIGRRIEALESLIGSVGPCAMCMDRVQVHIEVEGAPWNEAELSPCEYCGSQLPGKVLNVSITVAQPPPGWDAEMRATGLEIP